MTLLGFDDATSLAAAVAAIDAAVPPPTLTDAAGKPITPGHPLIARTPAAQRPHYLPPAFTASDKAGGLLRTNATADAALGAATVAARAKVDPPKPVTIAAMPAYVTALKALLPSAVVLGALAQKSHVR